MKTRPAPTPAAHPPPDTVGRILRAAEALFSRLGYDGASINDIAREAKVSKANIFHHFISKNELYLEVLRNACRDSAEHLQQLSVEKGALAERLAEFSENQLGHMIEQGRVSRLILRELLKDGDQRGRELAEKVFGDNFARLVEILRAGQARGELRSDVNPAMVATLLIGANVFFFEAQEVLRHFRDVDFARTPGRYSRMLVDILLRGIARDGTRGKGKT